MPNALFPRETIHAWSDQIAEEPASHQSSLQRLLRDQRRLTRWIEENQAQMNPATAGVCVYLTGVIARMFELGGGRLRNATWAQIREAETRISTQLRALLPYNDTFLDRLHAQGNRAQAHIVDEAAMVLFESPTEEGQEPPDPAEAVKILAMVWVITDVLDSCWQPPKAFDGDTSYTYVPITPSPLQGEASES